MINNLSKFFNDNPLISIVILILSIIIFWNIINTYTQSNYFIKEPMTNIQPISNCDINTDTNFNSGFVGENKLINFKCTYNGKEYYLATRNMSECQNRETDDCATSVLVLMDKNKIDFDVSKYLERLKMDYDVCQYTSKLKCINSLQSTTPSNVLAEEACNVKDPSCIQKRQYYHDFNVIELKNTQPDINSPERRSYIIEGTSIPREKNTSFPTLINQSLYYDKKINLMCGDWYNYRDPLLNREYAEVVIVERKVPNNGGIIGGLDSGLRVKIRFMSQELIISTINGVTQYTPVIEKDVHSNEEIKMTAHYLGVCKDKTCRSSTGEELIRLCLYPDILDKNVLEFEPILVNIS